MTAPVAPQQQFQPASGNNPDPTPRPDRGPLIQRVLLGAGALCVLVAGAVYLAVSWHRIGIGGQAGFALIVTVLAALGAHLLNRRGLRASAETFAVVAAGLLTLDLAGAHHLDVLGAAGLEWWLWLTVAAGTVLVVTTGLALVERLVAYRLVAVSALAVLPYTGLVAADRAGLDASSGALTAFALAVAAGLTAVAVAVSRRDAVTATAAVFGAADWWLIATAAGLNAAWSPRQLTDVVPAAVLWGAVGTALLVATGRALAAGRTDDTRIIVSVAGPLAAAPATLVLAGAVTSLGPLATLLTAAAVVALSATPWSATPAGRPLSLAAAVMAALLVPVGAARGFGFDVTGALVLVAGLAAVGGIVHGRGAGRAVATVAALAAAVVGTGLLAVERAEPALWLSASWTTIAVAAVLAGTFVTAVRDGLLAAGAAIGFLALMAGFAAQLLDSRSPALAIALLGLGAAALVHGAVRTSRTGVLLGAAGLAAAGMDLAAVARIDAVEAYTLPIAAVALVAGILGLVGRPELSSWAWTAPAVLVAVIPSTAVALGDPGITRLIVTAALAAVVTVAGLRFRLAAPLILGAATEAVLAVSQLAPYAVGAPRWITLALAGILLLTLGVLFERTRRGAVAAGRWYAALR